jgi:hypothetical protein
MEQSPIDFLDGQEESEDWQAGLGAGITCGSPRSARFASIVYGHGFNAVRKEHKEANQIRFALPVRFRGGEALSLPTVRAEREPL